MKTKTIKKNILIFGLGISGMSFANYLKDKVKNLYCWDDQLGIRKKESGWDYKLNQLII